VVGRWKSRHDCTFDLILCYVADGGEETKPVSSSARPTVTDGGWVSVRLLSLYSCEGRKRCLVGAPDTDTSLDSGAPH
jgi:hypothetical protein